MMMHTCMTSYTSLMELYHRAALFLWSFWPKLKYHLFCCLLHLSRLFGDNVNNFIIWKLPFCTWGGDRYTHYYSMKISHVNLQLRWRQLRACSRPACLKNSLKMECNNNKHWIYESRCFPTSITILAHNHTVRHSHQHQEQLYTTADTFVPGIDNPTPLLLRNHLIS